MNRLTSTIIDPEPELSVYTSGSWTDSRTESIQRTPFPQLRAAVAGAATYFLASTSTMVSADPLLLDRRRDNSVVVGYVVQIPRRRISMSEARRIALDAMVQSDRLRDEFAEREARTSALWQVLA